MKIDKIISCILFILTLYFIIFWLSPVLNTDGPWSFSTTASFMNGNINASTFSHDYMGQVFTVHVKKLLYSPFFYLFGISTTNLVLFNLLLLLSSSLLILKIFSKKEFKNAKLLLILPLLICSNYLLKFRDETLGVALSLLIILLFELKIKQNIKLILVGLIISISFFVHPMAGVSSSFLVFTILFIEQNKINHYFIILIAFILGLLVLSLGNIFDFLNIYSNSNESSNHSFTIKTFFKYILFNPSTLFILFFISKSNWIKTIFVIVGVLIISNFGRSYYFSYLIPLFVFLIKEENIELYNKKYIKIGCYCLVFYSVLLSHIIPLIRNVENLDYGKNMRKILETVRVKGNNLPKENIYWVPSQLGMEVMEHDNTRMYFHFYKTMSDTKIKLNEGDVLLVYQKKDLNYIYNNLNHEKEQLLLEQIVKPVKGKLSLSSGFRKRSDSIGLWSLKLKIK